MSSRDALVLLHPLGTSARVWDDVLPLLEPHHDVIALTALGHRGGAAPAHPCFSEAARRMVFRDVARHGERLTPDQAMEATRDLLACTVSGDLLRSDEEIAPLDPLPCPITLAWSGEDAICPLDVNGAIARERLPDARFVRLDGVGHLPMIDDPASVAWAIRQACAAVRPT